MDVCKAYRGLACESVLNDTRPEVVSVSEQYLSALRYMTCRTECADIERAGGRRWPRRSVLFFEGVEWRREAAEGGG